MTHKLGNHWPGPLKMQKKNTKWNEVVRKKQSRANHLAASWGHDPPCGVVTPVREPMVMIKKQKKNRWNKVKRKINYSKIIRRPPLGSRPPSYGTPCLIYGVLSYRREPRERSGQITRRPHWGHDPLDGEAHVSPWSVPGRRGAWRRARRGRCWRCARSCPCGRRRAGRRCWRRARRRAARRSRGCGRTASSRPRRAPGRWPRSPDGTGPSDPSASRWTRRNLRNRKEDQSTVVFFQNHQHQIPYQLIPIEKEKKSAWQRCTCFALDGAATAPV